MWGNLHRGFESLPLRQLVPSIACAPVAQWIERQVADLKVVGSSPAGRANPPSCAVTTVPPWLLPCARVRDARGRDAPLRGDRTLPSTRFARQRAALLVALVAVVASGLMAVPISAATSTVTGTITDDRGRGADSGGGRDRHDRRHDAPHPTPARSSASSGSTRRRRSRSTSPSRSIQAPSTRPTRTSCFATITDGTSTWQNQVGEPVITGGPTSGDRADLDRSGTEPARERSPAPPSRPTGTALSPQAVSIAALIKVETGTVVSRSVTPITDPANIAFSVGYDPGSPIRPPRTS